MTSVLERKATHMIFEEVIAMTFVEVSDHGITLLGTYSSAASRGLRGSNSVRSVLDRERL
jgi:hypothetical protein